MRLTTQVLEEQAMLLRRLVESFTDYPGNITIESKPLPGGRVDWRLRVNVNDQGKVIGKNGSHIRALQFLWAEVGESSGQFFVLRLAEEGVGKWAAEIPRPAPNPTFSCVGHRALLSDLFDQMLSERPTITVVREQGRVEFTFKVVAGREQDFERLVTQNEHGQTIVAALGTLWRAAGHKNGVGFKLEIPPR